jgi:hypothetical protein
MDETIMDKPYKTKKQAKETLLFKNLQIEGWIIA